MMKLKKGKAKPMGEIYLCKCGREFDTQEELEKHWYEVGITWSPVIRTKPRPEVEKS